MPKDYLETNQKNTRLLDYLELEPLRFMVKRILDLLCVHVLKVHQIQEPMIVRWWVLKTHNER